MEGGGNDAGQADVGEGEGEVDAAVVVFPDEADAVEQGLVRAESGEGANVLGGEQGFDVKEQVLDDVDVGGGVDGEATKAVHGEVGVCVDERGGEQQVPEVGVWGLGGRRAVENLNDSCALDAKGGVLEAQGVVEQDATRGDPSGHDFSLRGEGGEERG